MRKLIAEFLTEQDKARQDELRKQLQAATTTQVVTGIPVVSATPVTQATSATPVTQATSATSTRPVVPPL